MVSKSTRNAEGKAEAKEKDEREKYRRPKR